jgi:hypothetical protein
VVLDEKLRSTNEGDYQENKDPDYIAMPKGDNNEGKS